MSKFRIIQAQNMLGEIIYVPQYRRLLSWRTFSPTTKFYTLANAINFLKDNTIYKVNAVQFEL